ncbi:hypothetical protein FA15DRAFT_654809 [Coprinopsis marcescibilis]|uniref:Uncharacterized protein n=1 Tax=Coprinopsis marcescibilis TaxID=230819 RepID=A0A5C3KZ26_COPMA|nr:hypothetical protein FA15DRAFT_654809 [Coprinopsis marcescibilis]
MSENSAEIKATSKTNSAVEEAPHFIEVDIIPEIADFIGCTPLPPPNSSTILKLIFGLLVLNATERTILFGGGLFDKVSERELVYFVIGEWVQRPRLTIRVYRFVNAMADASTSLIRPIVYMCSNRWDTVAVFAVLDALMWVADNAVIYRCYVLWGRNYLVILPLVVLSLSNITINAATFSWFVSSGTILPNAIRPLLDVALPLHLVQSIAATGLIILRIATEGSLFGGHGIDMSFNGSSLMVVFFVILESAAIYTSQQLALLILYFLRHPAQLVVYGTFVPSIGIVFTLSFVCMQARRHVGRHSDLESPTELVFTRTQEISLMGFDDHNSQPTHPPFGNGTPFTSDASLPTSSSSVYLDNNNPVLFHPNANFLPPRPSLPEHEPISQV